jgi:hypothetical protein
MSGLLQIIIEALGWGLSVPSKKESEESQLVKAQRIIGIIITIGVILFVIICGLVALVK